jgi:putative colanic acid biosysnthesis UDP-glucose lipid carrier transferase
MSDQTIPLRFRRASSLNLGWNNVVLLAAVLLDPIALVLSLWAVAYYTQGRLTPDYLVLSLLVFSLTLPGKVRLQMSVWQSARSILLSWVILAGILIGFGYISGFIYMFEREAMLIWLWLAPLTLLAMNATLRSIAPSLAHI